MKRYICFHYSQFIIVFLIICVSYSWSHCQKIQPQFAVDHAQFRSSDNRVYLEVYYSVKRNTLTYNKDEHEFHAQAIIKTKILQSNLTIASDSLTLNDAVCIMDEISPTHRFTEISYFNIREGTYLLSSVLIDLNSNTQVTYEDSLTICAYPSDLLSMSEIELASIIKSQDQGSKFNKNGLYIVPNADCLYGNGLSELKFYAEAYNLVCDNEAIGSTYQVHYTISDINGNSVMELPGRRKVKPGTSTVIYGALPVDELMDNIYRLKITLTDEFTGNSTESVKTFFCVHEGTAADNLLKSNVGKGQALMDDLEFSEYENINEQALNELFEQVKYIASEEEIKVFENLNETGKRSFLTSFWKRRDPTPETVINEKQRDYQELLIYADAKFNQTIKSGWRSDRGRVLLVYGKPDQIDISEATVNTRAYQIWYYYDLEGGVEFVFVDYRGIGKFELVHSTMKNEIQDYDWETRYAH
ncbi:GWxTD domain-containing protein [candidate division KSB1 bacterium]|nr:GWxTD domain-containing protein [candidate division KSB1 bacterium]